MRGLVDTHALIWFLNDDGRLGRAARAFMRSGENELLMGLGSCWELAIKCSIGKITLSKPFDQFLWPQLVANNIQVLPITPDQLNMIGSLPHHHRDSFDRLLAAQAFADRAAVVSGDDALDAYGVERAW